MQIYTSGILEGYRTRLVASYVLYNLLMDPKMLSVVGLLWLIVAVTANLEGPGWLLVSYDASLVILC